MLSERLLSNLNKQINKELFSEYLYLSMAAFADSEGLPGTANWFKAQAQEEHTHAMKIYEYIYDRGGRVILDAIEKPKTDFHSIKELFEMSLEHEKFVTASINELMDIALSDNDHASVSFLKWFVDEQVEEEASVNAILDKFIYMKESGIGLLMLDRELSARK